MKILTFCMCDLPNEVLGFMRPFKKSLPTSVLTAWCVAGLERQFFKFLIVGEFAMDTTDLESKEMSESGKHEDTAVHDRPSETVCEEDKEAAVKGMSPRRASGSKSSDGAEEEGEVSPKKFDPVKSTCPASQSITMVISPTTSGGQKSQTLRIVSQEQTMTSAPIHTIQLPLKSSPIVLKAMTIPMPTKTVSIVAKPSASPVKASSTVVPSTSKMPSKTLGIRKVSNLPHQFLR